MIEGISRKPLLVSADSLPLFLSKQLAGDRDNGCTLNRLIILCNIGNYLFYTGILPA